MKRVLWCLLCSILLFTAISCDQENFQEENSTKSFNINYLYGKWRSGTECCVFKQDFSGYTFYANDEDNLSHFTWNLINNNELVLRFGNMLSSQTKYHIITELGRNTLKFYDKFDSNIKYDFSKPIENYIDANEIYGTWIEDDLFFQYKHGGEGFRENIDGYRDTFCWSLIQDTLTITYDNSLSGEMQKYIVTELSDTLFTYYNMDSINDYHTLSRKVICMLSMAMQYPMDGYCL